MKTLRIGSLDELGHFPSVPPLGMPAATPSSKAPEPEATLTTSSSGPAQPGDSPQPAATEPLIVTVGPFRLEVSRKLQRCNLTHAETMATAFVKMSERQCGGEVSFKKLDDLRWQCEEWNVTVHFPSGPGQQVVIDIEDHGVLLNVAT
jgi:hypothetical protein